MTCVYRIEQLQGHDRSQFDCGVQALNAYLQKRASQDVRRRVAACFVMIDNVHGAIAGYYTLSAGSVLLADLPDSTAKKLPRYPTVPIVRVGRLAIDRRYQGQKLGGVLLYDAIQRSARSDIGAFAVVVDAKDEAAALFYEHHGFLRLASAPRMLFLSIADGLARYSP